MNQLFIKDSSNTNMTNELEAGQTTTVTKGTFTTSSNSSTTGFDGGLTLTVTNNANALGTVTFDELTLDFPDLVVRKTTSGNITFTLTGAFTGGAGGDDTATDTAFVRHPYFVGATTIDADSSNINSLIDSILAEISGSNTATGDTSFSTSEFGLQDYINTPSTLHLPEMTITLPGSCAETGKFTYIVYPASYGDLSKILQGGVDPILGSFTQLAGDGDGCNHTRFSVSTEYIVYKSNLTGVFTIGDTILIDD